MPVSAELKKCPACAEMVQKDAKVCKYCRKKLGGNSFLKVVGLIFGLGFFGFVALVTVCLVFSGDMSPLRQQIKRHPLRRGPPALVTEPPTNRP